MASSDKRTRDIVDSIEHYHACKSASESNQRSAPDVVEMDDRDGDMDMTVPEDGREDLSIIPGVQVTPEMVEQVKLEKRSKRDSDYARMAVEIGRSRGIFTTTNTPLH
jgi:hypothetical protein